ncbi:Gfo/Idh/MocA family protein [Flavitalea sp.]|nr:Gfo/Idh/MocA family oxidoreductase [Flavitalea sp.]
MLQPLRFAIIGTGFWANYQIAAWKELQGVELVALCDINRSSVDVIAKKFGVSNVYSGAEELLEKETLDFVDIITDVDTHAALTNAAAQKGIDIICQKPMAASLADAEKMLKICMKQNVQLFIHENFRWQAPLRSLKDAMDTGIIGKMFKAKVSFCSAFPVFDNQPFLAGLKHFILADIGSHVLDICRFLFGEVKQLTCLIQRVNKRIEGEDVANVLMEMENGLHCFAEMSYASILEKEAFPQTLVSIEGENGSLHLTNDFHLKITTRRRTTSSVIKPAMYNWVDPDYAVVHSSIVDCNRDILKGLQGGISETTGEDNLRTVRLVWACYESAASKKTIIF